jgi:hypothetical protein
MPHPLLIEFLEPIEVTENDTTDSLKERAFEVMKGKVRREM